MQRAKAPGDEGDRCREVEALRRQRLQGLGDLGLGLRAYVKDLRV